MITVWNLHQDCLTKHWIKSWLKNKKMAKKLWICRSTRAICKSGQGTMKKSILYDHLMMRTSLDGALCTGLLIEIKKTILPIEFSKRPTELQNYSNSINNSHFHHTNAGFLIIIAIPIAEAMTKTLKEFQINQQLIRVSLNFLYLLFCWLEPILLSWKIRMVTNYQSKDLRISTTLTRKRLYIGLAAQD